MRYAFLVQYIGKNYAGSQLQLENGAEKEPTIQGELEKALNILCKPSTLKGTTSQTNRPIKAIFSGRTDRGVNSQGQVVHFDYDKTIVASSFIYKMNEILPKDISISDLKQVDETFHAQKSATKRTYKYEFIIGEHDFSSFKSSGTLNPSKVCHIYRAECNKIGDKVVIEIEGNRFLYNMVRTIIGTLLKIEGHNLEPEHMKDVLESRNRKKAGRTASPYGLTLMKVEYGDKK